MAENNNNKHPLEIENILKYIALSVFHMISDVVHFHYLSLYTHI